MLAILALGVNLRFVGVDIAHCECDKTFQVGDNLQHQLCKLRILDVVQNSSTTGIPVSPGLIG